MKTFFVERLVQFFLHKYVDSKIVTNNIFIFLKKLTQGTNYVKKYCSNCSINCSIIHQINVVQKFWIVRLIWRP